MNEQYSVKVESGYSAEKHFNDLKKSCERSYKAAAEIIGDKQLYDTTRTIVVRAPGK